MDMSSLSTCLGATTVLKFSERDIPKTTKAMKESPDPLVGVVLLPAALCLDETYWLL